MKRAAFYVRVSTVDQHPETQVTDAKLTRLLVCSLRQWSGFWFYSLVTRTGALNHRLFHS